LWRWGRAIAKREAGGVSVEVPKTEPLWLGFGRAVWNGDGGWCLGMARWHVPGGGGGGTVRSRNARRGGGLGRNQKPSCCGSVSGAPCETAMGDGASRWHGSTYEVVVVVGSCGREARGGEGVWVKIPKPSRYGSVWGAPCETAMGDGAWGWHGGTYQAVVVVGRCAGEMRGGEGGWAEIRNRAVVARFRAHRAKRRWGMVRRGGTVARTRRWWWWGHAVAKHEAGRGFE
jgi:hypothetical protein